MVHTTIPEARFHPKSALSHTTLDFYARAPNLDEPRWTKIANSGDSMRLDIRNTGFTREDSPLWLKRRHTVATKRTDGAGVCSTARNWFLTTATLAEYMVSPGPVRGPKDLRPLLPMGHGVEDVKHRQRIRRHPRRGRSHDSVVLAMVA